MIDIHAHILPGIDDGAEDIYDTLEMARMAVDSGVKAMVATPHCNLPGLFDNYFSDAYVKVFQDSVQALAREKIPLRLYPGMEAFATDNLPDLLVDGKIMPLNQSRYVLVEFSFDEYPDLKGKVVVHHGVEQQVLRKPQTKGLFTESEMHSLENLRGIPKEINSDLHLSKIRKEWNRFYKEFPNPTKEQLLNKRLEIDKKYGDLFNPPLK